VKSQVPTIDLELAEASSEIASDLDEACRDHGFFLLKNHGMEQEIEAMWKSAASFFGQAREVKRLVQRTESQPLGYYDRELTKRQRDLKEVFDFREVRPDKPDINQWPDNDPEFQKVMRAFFDVSATVAARTLTVLYQTLSGKRDVSALPRGSVHTSNARLNYYPLTDPLDSGEQNTVAKLGDMALHHHTDPGILTLLLQDMTGGLQALTRNNQWIDIAPRENTIVVNLGDMMQVWTNDTYKAAVHRVLPPVGRASPQHTAEARFSTPFFYSPEKDAVIEPLEMLMAIAPGSTPGYRAFSWREYIQGRINDNYTDLGEDDIQISRYKLGEV